MASHAPNAIGTTPRLLRISVANDISTPVAASAGRLRLWAVQTHNAPMSAAVAGNSADVY